MRSPRTLRAAWTAVALLLLSAFVVVDGLSGTGTTTSSVASSPALQLAADTSQFRPGNIISDDLFFAGNAMSAGDVQAFLNGKNPSCTAGAMPCLKNYTETTWTRPADAYCASYVGAPGETAAWIIAKVGQACGISQRVLLVLLQKEQGLVRASGSSLTLGRYQKATGYGCPDTAPCNTQYYGFYNQVYNAARRFKVYAANPQNYTYRAGRVNSILYSPNTDCGRSDVYIENQATAGLYIYTPYQPNAAAVAAGYGEAPCGAYGNRNFWLYYTDWFGYTQSNGGNAVVERALAASAQLGSASSSVVCGLPAQGGCFQAFANGSVYWSPATGAKAVRGAIGQHWAELGWETGMLGYPTSEESCGLRASGCFQEFQNGAMYWSSTTGAHPLFGALRVRWNAQAWETGPLGYPVRDEVCGTTGCYQKFEGGNVYWSSATGARVVSGAQLTAWGSQQYERGPLGYPTGEATCGLRDSGCYQHFQGGSIYSSATGGVRIVIGEVRDAWQASGWERGVLGYPVGDLRCGYANGGCFQNFEHGSIYVSDSTPASVVTAPAQAAWATQQWERGPLGYPTSDTVCGLRDSGCYQHFQGGSVYSSASGGRHVVTGAILDRWAAQKWERGALGYPTADQVCGLARGGCSQAFQNGTIHTTATTGAHAVTGAFAEMWAATSRETGPLGYPVGEQTCGLVDGGCFQHFEAGSIYSSAGSGTYAVLEPIRGAWRAQGWEQGRLGYPIADQTCGLAGDGCSQQFRGGLVSWSPDNGAHVVLGAIRGSWTSTGAEGGPLGYPIGSEQCHLVRSGCFQVFENGSVYWSPTTGAHPVSGLIRDAWKAAQWERGTLGYPTGDPVTTPTEITQQFEGGTLAQNRSTGQVTRR